MKNCTQVKADILSEEEECRIRRNQIDILNQLALLDMEDRLMKIRFSPSIAIPTGDSNPCEIGYLCY